MESKPSLADALKGFHNCTTEVCSFIGVMTHRLKNTSLHILLLLTDKYCTNLQKNKIEYKSGTNEICSSKSCQGSHPFDLTLLWWAGRVARTLPGMWIVILLLFGNNCWACTKSLSKTRVLLPKYPKLHITIKKKFHLLFWGVKIKSWAELYLTTEFF